MLLSDEELHGEEAHTAANRIQRFMRQCCLGIKTLRGLRSSSAPNTVVLTALESNTAEFEEAMTSVFNENYFKSIQIFLSLAYFPVVKGISAMSPLSPGTRRTERMANFKVARVVSSSALIAKYPHEMLSNGDSSGDFRPSKEALGCVSTSKIVTRSIAKVLHGLESSSKMSFYHLLVQFQGMYSSKFQVPILLFHIVIIRHHSHHYSYLNLFIHIFLRIRIRISRRLTVLGRFRSMEG